jgi:hypothetical protein
VFGTDSFTAAEVTRRYGDSGETFEAAVAEWVSGRGVIDARSIGNALKRIVGGMAFVKAGEDTPEGTNRWRIKAPGNPTIVQF